MNWHKEIVAAINSSFGSPFLPEGYVEARVLDSPTAGSILNLRIGDRDVDFTLRGNSCGAGTFVVSGRKWSYVKRLTE